MGQKFSFIHCADLHLGEPFSGLQDSAESPWGDTIRQATCKAFENVVTAAIERQVNAILISGDVYDSETHSLAAQIAFARELYRAAVAHIEVFIVHGNHDPATSGWQADIPMAPTIHIFPADHVASYPLKVKGETVAKIYGMSYQYKHITENLSRRFTDIDKNLFTIGMLHTEVGQKDSPYAPCTIEDLRQTGITYWALGHIHERQTLSTEPYIVYPGNTQGLDISETGPKGCYLVEVGEYGTIHLEFIETDVMQWVHWPVDISSFQNPEELWQYIYQERAKLREKKGRPLIVRIELTGRGPLAQALTAPEAETYILQTLNDKEKFHHTFCYFADIKNHTAPLIDLDKRRKLPDEIGTYLATYDDIAEKTDSEKIKILRQMIENEPELLKFPTIRERISDKRLKEAFWRAEMRGVERLWEDEE